MISKRISRQFGILIFVLPLTTFADEPQIGGNATKFIYKGIDHVLTDCKQLTPPKNCRQGKLIHAGRKQQFTDNNSGEKLSYQEFTYEGMTLIYRANSIVTLIITGANWPKYLSLGIGVPREKVSKILGAPNSFGGPENTASYCSTEVDDCVTFVFNKSGIVSEIRWELYYD